MLTCLNALPFPVWQLGVMYMENSRLEGIKDTLIAKAHRAVTLKKGAVLAFMTAQFGTLGEHPSIRDSIPIRNIIHARPETQENMEGCACPFLESPTRVRRLAALVGRPPKRQRLAGKTRRFIVRLFGGTALSERCLTLRANHGLARRTFAPFQLYRDFFWQRIASTRYTAGTSWNLPRTSSW